MAVKKSAIIGSVFCGTILIGLGIVLAVLMLATGDVKTASAKDGGGDGLDYSCETNADCAVKDIGSCCGYSPACVNVNAAVDPEGVKQECAEKGMVSICGFQHITSCSCQNHTCVSESVNLQPQ